VARFESGLAMREIPSATWGQAHDPLVRTLGSDDEIKSAYKFKLSPTKIKNKNRAHWPGLLSLNFFNRIFGIQDFSGLLSRAGHDGRHH
jgi:hypothetical protein